jgi:hypothetical protein
MHWNPQMRELEKKLKNLEQAMGNGLLGDQTRSDAAREAEFVLQQIQKLAIELEGGKL